MFEKQKKNDRPARAKGAGKKQPVEFETVQSMMAEYRKQYKFLEKDRDHWRGLCQNVVDAKNGDAWHVVDDPREDDPESMSDHMSIVMNGAQYRSLWKRACLASPDGDRRVLIDGVLRVLGAVQGMDTSEIAEALRADVTLAPFTSHDLMDALNELRLSGAIVYLLDDEDEGPGWSLRSAAPSYG